MSSFSYAKSLIPTSRFSISFSSFKHHCFVNRLSSNIIKSSSWNINSHYTTSKDTNSYSDHTSLESNVNTINLTNIATNTTDHYSNGNPLNSYNRQNPLNYNPSQLYKLVLDNYNHLSLPTLLKYVEILQDSNLSDPQIINALSTRLLLDLNSIDNSRDFGYFFRLLEPNSAISEDLFTKVINHIYTNKIYPSLSYPRIWVSYFKFLGSNRIYHKNLYDDLIVIYNEYLDLHISTATLQSQTEDESDNYVSISNSMNVVDSNDVDNINKKPFLNRRFQESIGTVIWCLSICNIRNDQLINRVVKIVDLYNMETSVLVRILWGFTILNVKLTNLFQNPVSKIKELLEETVEEASLKKLSHINQIYSSLKSLRYHLVDPDISNSNSNDVRTQEISEIDNLMEVCKQKLLVNKYAQSGKIISKSQKLVSDFLIRANIPHQLEIITSDLLSIDIRIMLDDDMVALEVDGPTHFLRNIEHPDVALKTGPCLFKKQLLTKSGYKYISIPFYNNHNKFSNNSGSTASTNHKYSVYEEWDNVKEMDSYYKSILMDCDSEKLKHLLSKYS